MSVHGRFLVQQMYPFVYLNSYWMIGIMWKWYSKLHQFLDQYKSWLTSYLTVFHVRVAHWALQWLRNFFFSVHYACLSFYFDFGACQLCCLVDLPLCKISLIGLHKQWFPWVPDYLPLNQCTRWPVRAGADPRSTRGLRVSDLLPFLC